MGYGVPAGIAAKIIGRHRGNERMVLTFAVDTTTLFAPALQRALAHIGATGLPALIELRYDPNLITPNTTLEVIWKGAQAPHSASGSH